MDFLNLTLGYFFVKIYFDKGLNIYQKLYRLYMTFYLICLILLFWTSSSECAVLLEKYVYFIAIAGFPYL